MTLTRLTHSMQQEQEEQEPEPEQEQREQEQEQEEQEQHHRRAMQALILSGLGQCELDAQNTPAYTLGRPAVAEMARTQMSPLERDFLAVPTAASARANLMHITSRPHVAGTPGDYAMAQFVLHQIKAANP